MSNKIDIVYKTYSGDAKWLWDSIRSVVKYVNGYGNFYILSDDPIGATPHDLADLHIIRSETPILAASRWQKGNPSVGYFNQILIKLNLFHYLPLNVNRVLLLDSDMLIKANWDITTEPNRWFYRDWSGAGDGIIWKGCIDALFGDNPNSQQAMGFPGWFLTRGLMNELLAYLANRLGHKEIDNDFWNHLSRITHYKLSEFEVMGNFLHLVAQLDYGLQPITQYDYPIKQFRSWDGYENCKAEIDAILNA